MSNNIYIAKQPILNKDNEIFAYELLYKDNETSSSIKNSRLATVAVLSSTLNKFGIRDILGEYKAFIRADEKFIMHEIIDIIPKEYFIFSLTFNKEITKQLKDKIFDLHSKGYEFAINDTSLQNNLLDSFNDIMQCISFIKIDVNTPIDRLLSIKKLDLKIIITKVETDDMRLKAEKMGCDYVQGYFFCVPKILEQEKFNPNAQNVINICNKLMNDCAIDDIVVEFENNPALSIQLLKFINSGKFHFRKKLSSIKQVLTLVGKTKLTQWLMLMVYSSFSDQNEANTLLLEHVKKRCALMEKVAKLIDDKLVSQAYFIGVISLMDALFGVSIRVILKEMNVDRQIKEALLKKENKLGEIYSFILAIEIFDTKAIEEYANKNNISLEDLSNLSLNALKT